MSFLDDVMGLLAAACRVGSDACLSAIARSARQTCVFAWLLAGGLVLLLGAMGLMIAALFIGLTPHLGAHWAAMIAAGAALAGSGLFMALALLVSRR